MRSKRILKLVFYIVFLGTLTVAAVILNLPPSSPQGDADDQVKLIINYGNGTTVIYVVDITENDTVFSVLCRVANVSWTSYSNGVFVTAINGVEGDWIYYVNGMMPGVASDKYFLRGGETLEWKRINS